MNAFYDYVIVGAGPAGITAALELAKTQSGSVLILEQDSIVGGISKTINYKGNRIDIGGHRFFSKSDWVNNWWTDILSELTLNECATNNDCFLRRKRISRIYFKNKFYDYPIKLNANTIANLGIFECIKLFTSYLNAKIKPIENVSNLEEFFINRFGKHLYETFFKDYTQKVWGKPCNQISSKWGAQRIKSLDVSKAIFNAIKSMMGIKSSAPNTLIEEFLYPKYGPGQLWQKALQIAVGLGTQIYLNAKLTKIYTDKNKVVSVEFRDLKTQAIYKINTRYLISSVPIKELVNAIEPKVDAKVLSIANGLEYRDFISVGILLKQLSIESNDYRAESGACKIPDNWIYVQDKGVNLGRIQLFNNWSPFLVRDINTVWLGLEYFCNEGDELWNASNKELINLGLIELEKIGIAKQNDFLDGVVIKQPKAYPGYFGTYDYFDKIKDYLDSIDNLFLIGRNGMHRYNNQDHSMLSAKKCVECILGKSDKSQIWSVNIDDEYHEGN